MMTNIDEHNKPAMYTAFVVQLLPGGPCEDYVYRFRQLGMYEQMFATREEAHAWWRNCVEGSVAGLAPWPHDFCGTGWSGWHPYSKVGVRLREEDFPRADGIAMPQLRALLGQKAGF